MTNIAEKMTPEERHLLLESSVERMINTTLNVLPFVGNQCSRDIIDDRDINFEDWKAMKDMVTKITNLVRDECFIVRKREIDQIQEGVRTVYRGALEEGYSEEEAQKHTTDFIWSKYGRNRLDREAAITALVFIK